MGGSWTQTVHQGQDCNREFNRNQGAHEAADSTPPTTEQPLEGFLATGCGRIEEYLALAPWSEKREGLRATQSEIERHLHLHNSTCHLLTVMLEELSDEAILTQVPKNFNNCIAFYNTAGCQADRWDVFNQNSLHQNLTWESARLQSSRHCGWDS